MAIIKKPPVDATSVSWYLVGWESTKLWRAVDSPEKGGGGGGNRKSGLDSGWKLGETENERVKVAMNVKDVSREIERTHRSSTILP